jgi:hypothetical protein
VSDKNPARIAAGKARAASLSAKQRTEIARKAAEARWTADLPEADFEGDFFVGDKHVSSAVLRDETRVITQATFLRALSRSRSPKAGTGVLSTLDELPFFLKAEVLRPFIDEGLKAATKPIFYRTRSGGKGVGYDATLLRRVAEVYVRFGEHCRATKGEVPARYQHMVAAAEALITSLADVAIVALVDEATGYQNVRNRVALQQLFDAFLKRELAAWAKRFPDEFYKQIYRLRGWEWRGRQFNPPQVVAHYTNDFVYERLAPGIREELERRMPVSSSGDKKGKLHQLLTDEIGHPALAQHLHAITALMRGARNWDEFLRLIDASFPKRGTNLQLDFVDEHQAEAYQRPRRPQKGDGGGGSS